MGERPQRRSALGIKRVARLFVQAICPFVIGPLLAVVLNQGCKTRSHELLVCRERAADIMRCEGSRCTLDDTKSKQAETCFDRLIALHPNYAEAQVGKCDLLASHYSGAGFWPSFLECYDTALALKPDLVEAWIGKGVVFYKMGTDISLFRHDRGSLAEAVRCFDRVLALKPDHADARHWKDKALFAMERQ